MKSSNKKLNVLVLCGGQSPEHCISIRSTRNILDQLDSSRYHITLIGISQSGSWQLLHPDQLSDEITHEGQTVGILPGDAKPLFLADTGEKLEVDVIFPMLHGPNGEDGTIQAVIKSLNLPFVGPGVLSSAACMDKDITKRILRDAGIGVADWLLIRKADASLSYDEATKKLGKILFVKPANMGSSVGVHCVRDVTDWNKALEDAFAYDSRVLIEGEVIGREMECAVLGNDEPQASGVGEVRSDNFYSFDEKYDDSSQAQTIIPAEVNTEQLALLKETAIRTYQVLCCEGLSRVDMFLTAEDKVYVNEVNTMPGFTSISMYPKLWEQEGLSYTSLLDKLIQLALSK